MLQIILLAGKFVFLIVLYLFIWRVVLSINRDLRQSLPGGGRPAYRPTDSRGEEVGHLASGAPAGAQVAGSQTWTLVVVKSPHLRAGEAFAFPPGASAIAGRSPEMDIYLDDTFVSSKHALFEAGVMAFQVEDLHSTNGTLVNGRPISGVHELRPGDRVEVGDTIFQVEVR